MQAGRRAPSWSGLPGPGWMGLATRQLFGHSGVRAGRGILRSVESGSAESFCGVRDFRSWGSPDAGSSLHNGIRDARTAGTFRLGKQTSMDGSGSATERVVESRQADTAGAGVASDQGALGSRRVSPISEGAPGPSIQQGRQAGEIAGADVKCKPMGSRETEALPSSGGSPGSPSGQGGSGQAPERRPQSPPSQMRERRLPWLAPHEEAARRRFDAKVDDLLDADGTTDRQSESLCAVADILSQVEDETRSVDNLLERARSGWLSPQDWRKMSSLFRSNRHDLNIYRSRLAAELSGLVEAGVLSAADAALARQSLQRLAETHGYLTSSDLPWADLVRRIDTKLPIGRASRS